jgi:hypothetical protein
MAAVSAITKGPTMSRKDQLRIAAVLRRTRTEWDDSEGIFDAVIDGITIDLAEYFATADPTFEPRKFFAAAGLPAGTPMTKGGK